MQSENTAYFWDMTFVA